MINKKGYSSSIIAHVTADTIGSIGSDTSLFPFIHPLHCTDSPVSSTTTHAGPPQLHWSAPESTISIELFISLFEILFILLLVFLILMVDSAISHFLNLNRSTSLLALIGLVSPSSGKRGNSSIFP